MNEGLQNINLRIRDTDINVKVPKESEEIWRKAVQLINRKLNDYYTAYTGKKGEREITYFAMIDIALNVVAEEKKNDVEPIMSIISKLSDEVTECLKK